jgi:hypothetical protein
MSSRGRDGSALPAVSARVMASGGVSRSLEIHAALDVRYVEHWRQPLDPHPISYSFDQRHTPRGVGLGQNMRPVTGVEIVCE